MSEQIDSAKSGKASEWALAVAYGVPLAVFWIALFWFTAFREIYKMPFWLQLLNWCASFFMVYLCIKEYRKRFEQPSDMTYGKAVRVGFLQALVAAPIYALAVWAMISFLFSDYIENMLDEAFRTTMEMVGSSDQADAQFELMEKFITPWVLGVSSFVNALLSGLIYALVAAAVLRRKKPVNTSV